MDSIWFLFCLYVFSMILYDLHIKLSFEWLSLITLLSLISLFWRWGLIIPSLIINIGPDFQPFSRNINVFQIFSNVPSSFNINGFPDFQSFSGIYTFFRILPVSHQNTRGGGFEISDGFPQGGDNYEIWSTECTKNGDMNYTSVTLTIMFHMIYMVFIWYYMIFIKFSEKTHMFLVIFGRFFGEIFLTSAY